MAGEEAYQREQQQEIACEFRDINCKEKAEADTEEHNLEGSIDQRRWRASKGRSGGWQAGIFLLVNHGLVNLAFHGVEVNLVLFLTRVLRQKNADAASNISKWTGTVHIFSLVGASIGDSSWGRYKTCAIFQVIFVIGLVLLSVSSQVFLLKPAGCGDEQSLCGAHSTSETAMFYVSIYLIALGDGAYDPSIATFGADQFDEEDTQDGQSKGAFFSYFYLALNLGSLFSYTLLGYFEDDGKWILGFWVSSATAIVALLFFLCGTRRYRHIKSGGNPLRRVFQVIIAAVRKWRVEMPHHVEDLHEFHGKEYEINGSRKIPHTKEFRFLDRAAVIIAKDSTAHNQTPLNRPWHLCTVTQVEEVKCMLRLFPIWLCTIIYSAVFTQMASLFIEQGDAMKTTISVFYIPPASMMSFNILSGNTSILMYRWLLNPLVCRQNKKNLKGLTELQRMGVGLIIAAMAMVSAGIVEHIRLKYSNANCHNCKNLSSLSILWQIPQYALIGASEVFMYVGQLEFFNGQAPDGLKSFGSALCMTSMSMGNYVSSLLVTIVMKITAKDDRPGWIPGNLKEGHMDWFFFLLAALTTANFAAFLACARCYRCIKLEGKYVDRREEEIDNV